MRRAEEIRLEIRSALPGLHETPSRRQELIVEMCEAIEKEKIEMFTEFMNATPYIQEWIQRLEENVTMYSMSVPQDEWDEFRKGCSKIIDRAREKLTNIN